MVSVIFKGVGILPEKGGDTGSVSVRIFGSEFVQGVTVKLIKDGEPDIVGDSVTVGDDGTTITTTFDLTGKSLGLWDVVVTNPDGTSFTLPDGFTIEEGRAAQVWVDIIGRDVIRVGWAQTFNILYGNRGNVDAVGVPLWIAGIPSDATLKLGFDTTSLQLPDGTLADGIDEVPVALDVDGEIVIALLIPVIPPDSAGVLKIAITVPTSSDFELRAWQNPPFFRSSLSLPVAECISALAKQIAGFFPGGSCLSALGEELSQQLARIFITNDSEKVKIGDVFYNGVMGCIIGEFIKTEALQHVRDMISAIASGVATGVECGEAFPATSDVVQQVQTVTSFDPNEKVGSKGVGEKQYLSVEEPLRYVIFFENMETATAPAQEVIITDQLDMENMDMNTLSLGPISFGTEQVIPSSGLSSFATDVDLRPDNDLIVRIEVSLNQSTGLLTWRFTSIDPETGELPESPMAGFLPPNVTPPEGEGNVIFTVMPKEGLATGTEVRNKANIVFDLNSPIETNEWFNTISGDVVPDIKANGSDGPMTISQGNLLEVTASLDLVSYDEEDADWWVAANTPIGWYYFDASTMSWAYAGDSYTDLSFTYQGPLFNLSPYTIPEISTQPVGTYTFYFGVDMIMNGSLDFDELVFDSVVVNITP